MFFFQNRDRDLVAEDQQGVGHQADDGCAGTNEPEAAADVMDGVRGAFFSMGNQSVHAVFHPVGVDICTFAKFKQSVSISQVTKSIY